MTVGSLFSGIGGWDLGLQRAGFRTIWFAESDPFRRVILESHWPGRRIYEDVREIPLDAPRPDVLCASFPCQDLSLAGKRRGVDGPVSGIWREIIRLLRQFRPAYLLMENVIGLRSAGFDLVLAELAKSGYDAEWDCVAASHVGAPHERDRVWIVAYPSEVTDWAAPAQSVLGPRFAAELGRLPEWPAEPGLDRMAHGVSGGVDRRAALGDSLLPAIAEALGHAVTSFHSEQEARTTCLTTN